jgi:hypothetical protein
MVARWLVVFAKALHARGGHGVESGGLQINFKPFNRGHVAAIDWATCHHSICCKQAMSPTNCANSYLPCVVRMTWHICKSLLWIGKILDKLKDRMRKNLLKNSGEELWFWE